MNLFKSKLMNRIALGKTIGFLFWLIAFLVIPLIFKDASLMLRFAVLLWYTALWASIGVYWTWTKYPFWKIKIPYWIRGTAIWAMMNFILVLFIYENISTLMVWSIFDWFSPFWLILEWAIFWLIVDYITTTNIWEWKSLIIKKKKT